MAVEIKEGEIIPFKQYSDKFAEVFPGARTTCFQINFEFASGGMGDYICWIPALQWIAKNCPWVYGRLWAPAYFIEIVRHFFDDIPNWQVGLIEKFKDPKLGSEPGTLIRGLQSTPQQLLNATGAHLVRQGFANFANMDTIPEGTTYPEIRLDKPIHKALRGLEKKYIVFTPGGTTPSRFVPAKYWNPLIDYVISIGLTPVFLGKTHLADVHRSYFDDEVHYEKGIDLREKTTLLEAAKIMKESACVIGLDNGLLHLAACTDASIVFAYNIAAPKDRRPIRKAGKLVEITIPDEALPCIHCQTKFKLLYTHNFKNCIVRADPERKNKCIDLLFWNDGDTWKQAIQEAIR